MTKGIRECEQCKKKVMEWTRREIMVDGKFYSVCRTCFGEWRKGQAGKDFDFSQHFQKGGQK